MTDLTTPDGGGDDGLTGPGALGAPGGAAFPDESAFPGDAALPDEAVGLAAERERLARQLRDTRMQLAMTQARLTALQGSAKMRFGTVLANAAHRPWPRGVQLPRELYKLWRERGLKPTGSQNAAAALATAQLTDLAGTGERFLSSLTAPGVGAPALVITGALSALGCATLAPDAVVHPLLPHDADVVLEGTGADLVVVEAAAMLPGNPWAYATDPAAADRGRRLARMIVMARSLGKPVVLVRNVPQSRMPGLSWLALTCDAVVDTDFGVQLARFNPLGLDAGRDTAPVYAGERDPREAPAVRALLDALTSGDDAAVRLAGARSWRALPGLYRRHAVFVTASRTQGLEQQASGARVIQLTSGTAADEIRAALRAASDAGPLPLSEVRTALRDIFETHATPAKLTALLRAAGLPASLVGGRQVAVLAQVPDAAAAGRLADAVLRQRLRPAEVIVAASDEASVREALCGLADHGIRVVVSGAGTTETFGGIEWARTLARQGAAPWAAPWPADGPGDELYLLDLACARECAQADAVGFGSGAYEFARTLGAPALARRDLLLPDGPPAGEWGARGLRLLTVTP
jgi:hypothetical protein